MVSLYRATLLAGLVMMSTAANAADPLAAGFAYPPMSARPRVWWHWMNGNVTPDGIKLDLEWMKRVGIGGVQNFDAALATPQIVDKRLSYMSPDWQAAFRGAVTQADAAGLEFAIASSPGWSETGGPWVAPADGIKKFVWSETNVPGGVTVGMVGPPPNITGPFQAVPKRVDPIAAKRPGPPESFYGDIVVLAYPAAPAAVFAAHVAASGATARAANVGDGLVDGPFEIATDIALPEVRYDFAKAVTLRAATLAFDSGGTLFTPPRYTAVLEAAADGVDFHPVAAFPAGPTPQYTISFPALTARAWRIVFKAGPPPSLAFTPVPGAIKVGVGSLAERPGKASIRVEGVVLSATDRVNRFEEKAGFEAPFDYYALERADVVAGIDPAGVVDITRHLRSDGSIDWTPPPGRWTILQLGYSLTGKENHPATLEATGLEVDKLDGDAVGRYIDHYLDSYAAVVGADKIGASGIRAFLNDSIEVGPANWTPRLVDEFRARRGYDPLPWLPALTGTIIGDSRRSDAFLHDFRATLADLIADKHYRIIAERAQARGLRTYGEALEFGRPSLGDDMAMRRFANVPMAAMWTYPPADRGPRPVYQADIRGAASVAHIYGQNIVAAESLTSAWAPWAFAPRDLKPMIDLEFALGVNLPVIHTSVHQPVTSKAPGLSLAIFGQHFNRLETWAEQAGPWVDYIGRSAFMLQAGRSVADVLYFYGEEAPLTAAFNAGPPRDAPSKHDYDFANVDVLMNQVAVDQGKLVTKSGQSYALLWLGGSSNRMSVSTLRRVQALVAAGATVAGKRPERSPSLADDPQVFAELVAAIWDVNGSRSRIFAAATADEALGAMRMMPDFDWTGGDAETDLLFKHRAIDDGHVYFLTNRRARRETVTASFGVAGLVPTLWNATDGSVHNVKWHADGKMTRVSLDLDPEDAVFVVFRPERAGVNALQDTQLELVEPIDAGWQRALGTQAMKPVALGSWTQETSPDERYFSGVGRYQNKFTVSDKAADLWLDLGNVGDIAEVFVDGKPISTVWHPPFKVKLPHLASGNHQLEVRVTNLWVNRLIGDQQSGATRTTFTAVPTYHADAPLRPSGLFGPVRLLKIKDRQ